MSVERNNQNESVPYYQEKREAQTNACFMNAKHRIFQKTERECYL